MQSFLWGEKGKASADELQSLIDEKTYQMDCIVGPTLYNLLNSEDYLFRWLYESTYRPPNYKPTFVKTLKIGDVPDRGGRINMVRVGSMPLFAPRKNSEGGGGGRGGRGGGRGGGGRGGGGDRGRGGGRGQRQGRVQSGWNQY
jgi:uncharacterized membrane protein YgcG